MFIMTTQTAFQLQNGLKIIFDDFKINCYV